MSDSAETTFKINDLLISVVPPTDPDVVPTQIVSGTILTNVITYWPDGAILCGRDGQSASLASGEHDTPLLAGVKALLRAQIAELEGQQNKDALTSLMPATVEQAAALEAKLSAALDAVRAVKTDLEGTGGA